jgi:bifunctional DNase/RNase
MLNLERVQLNIIGLSYSQTQTGAYALVLSEVGGKRRLPIIIGGNEAQSIAIALEKDVAPQRPLTHDLFRDLAIAFDITVKEVIIHKLEDGVFFASLICEDQAHDLITLDARTSDAIALAVRFEAPIYTYEEILSKAGIILDEDENEDELKKPTPKKEATKAPKAESSSIEKSNTNSLKSQLEQAVKNEDYELAAKIRDELTNRGEA